MKIEIELDYIEQLKKEINWLHRDNSELKEKLKLLDEKKLRNDALDLAAHIFTESIARVFREIGFSDTVDYAPKEFGEFERILGVNWYGCERLHIELGAEITTEMRRAFLRMGIKSESKEGK